MVENHFDRKIKIFQCDGGLEYNNTALQDHCLSSGIIFRKSCPETQAQNCIVERKYKHILEMVRTFLIQSQLLSTYWVEAAFVAIFTINCLPTPVHDNKSPFEKLFHRIPDYNFLGTFHCECFPNIPASSSNKLQPRSVPSVFFGYTNQYKGYGKIYVSQHVCFHENVFPFQDLSSTRAPMLRNLDCIINDILTLTSVALSSSPVSTLPSPPRLLSCVHSATSAESETPPSAQPVPSIRPQAMCPLTAWALPN